MSAAARGSLNVNLTAISGRPASAQSWDYDPTGNWRGYHAAANGTTTLDQHRVHDRGNRLTQIEDNPNNMILDRVGRIRQMAPDAGGDWDGKLEITWDAWSRITSVRNNGEVVGDYAYDGSHRRITREVDGEKMHSYYNDAWRPVEERMDAETMASTSYLWGSRHRDDLVRRDRATSGTTLEETRYILMDYFNPAAIIDEAGTVKERYAFSAFGVRAILNPDYTERSSSECGMEFAFQGQFLDEESGLMNYGYRYYSALLGRWACKDPIVEKGGTNLYIFVGNSGENKIDHLGLAYPLAEQRMQEQKPSPSALDQTFAGPKEGGYLREEEFFEKEYPNLLLQAKSELMARVNTWVVSNCGQPIYSVRSIRAIMPSRAPEDANGNVWSDKQFGDKGQNSTLWKFAILGSFTFELEIPIMIAYKPLVGKPGFLIFEWEASLVVKDVLGFNEEDFSGASWLKGPVMPVFPERTVKRAKWKIRNGGACCPKQ